MSKSQFATPEIDISGAEREVISFYLSVPGGSEQVQQGVDVTVEGRIGFSRDVIRNLCTVVSSSTILWLPEHFKIDTSEEDSLAEGQAKNLSAVIMLGNRALDSLVFPSVISPVGDEGIVASDLFDAGMDITESPRANLWILTSRSEKLYEPIILGGLMIDRNTKTVIEQVGGETVPFTPKEFAVFSLLVENFGKVCTIEFIYDNIWGGCQSPTETNSLRVYIGKVRQKLQKYGLDGLIKTRFDIGYELELLKNED